MVSHPELGLDPPIGSDRESGCDIIHPSLITQLCRLAKVPMLDSEEQVQQGLPIALPKVKFGSPGDSDEETDDDAPATTSSMSDPEDSDPKVPSSSTQSLAY